MSVRKRKDGQYQVDVCDGPYRVRRVAQTQRQALSIESRLRRDVADRRSPTFGIEAALDRYIKDEAPRLRDSRHVITRCEFIKPFILQKDFDDISAIVQDIKKTLGGAGYKPATINRRLALLRRLCNLAWREWGWLDTPIGQKVRLLREHNQRHIYLSPAEVELICSYCKRKESAIAIRLAAYTGLRRGELLRLGKANVRVPFVTLDAGTKSGRPRLIPLPESELYLLDHIPLKVTDQSLRLEWESARRAAGFAHVRFHDLRHTYASWLAQANVSLETIGNLLGHSQASTTQRYAHLSPESLQEAVRKLK